MIKPLIKKLPSQSSATNPLQLLGLDLVAWFRGDDAVLLGNNVSQWNDKSSYGNHATQTTDLLRPTYDASINGKNSLNFTGGKWLQLPNFLQNSWGQASLFIVYNFANTSTDMSATSLGSNTDSYWWANGVTAFNSSFFGEFRNTRLPGQPPGGANSIGQTGLALVEVISGISSYTIHRNAIQLLNTTPSWGITTTPYVGRGANTGTPFRFFTGNIAEIVIVKREVTSTEVTELRKYFKQYYSLTSF